MAHQIIAWLLLGLGLVFGAVLLRRGWREREALRQERGRMWLLCALEVPIYFLATLGISDFLLHTLLLRRGRLTADENLPGTLIAAGLTPGAVIAFALLQGENPVELPTLLLCCAGIAGGSVLGARFVRRLDGGKIRRIMAVALIASMAVLILKLILSAGASGAATGLSPWFLALAVVFSLFWGAVNMVGVPMKAAGTAFFLLLGMSPLSTLTLVLVMGCLGPMSGSVEVIRGGRYHRKTVCAAVIFGSLGAVLGCLFTVAISPLALNVLLLAVMLVAIVTMLRK